MQLIQHWINGKLHEAESERRGPVFNPATGKQAAEVAFASVADVDLAVQTAKAALP